MEAFIDIKEIIFIYLRNSGECSIQKDILNTHWLWFKITVYYANKNKEIFKKYCKLNIQRNTPKTRTSPILPRLFTEFETLN